MKMSFARSGGFAGPATSLEGEVIFAAGSAQVISGPDYKREVEEDESRELRASIARATAGSLQARGRLRDAFQYDVFIVDDENRTLRLTIHGEKDPVRDFLSDWIRNECARIWATRTGRMP